MKSKPTLSCWPGIHSTITASPSSLLERAAQMLRDYRKPVVILPGNHDPLTPDSVYRRGGLGEISNVSILGLNVDKAVLFPEFDLEIWGHAHFDYTDMSPLANPRPRTTRWQLAAAHGHYVDEVRDPNRMIGSWLIHREELIATGADYVALGHWNQSHPGRQTARSPHTIPARRNTQEPSTSCASTKMVASK